MDQLFVWGLQGLGGILMSVLWYRMKEKDVRLERLEQRLAETREQYVHKDDLKEWKQEINHRFDKLETLIRGNVHG